MREVRRLGRKEGGRKRKWMQGREWGRMEQRGKRGQGAREESGGGGGSAGRGDIAAGQGHGAV